MAYARLPEEHSGYDKEELSLTSPYSETHCLSYRNLFGATILLWIATSATLGWALAQKSTENGGHVAGPLPFAPVPSRIVTFEPNPKFHYTAKDAGESAWMSLMPNDGGIVSISDPSKYQLASSYKNKNASNAEVYSMSMFHQLHCLNSIRVRLGELEGFINSTVADTERRNVFAPESHVNHCFDYLRQAIMCAGDLSLEHSVVPEQFGFNGWGTSHQCANWDVMWILAVEHRYEQSTEQSAGML